jgi:hypothetical protein
MVSTCRHGHAQRGQQSKVWFTWRNMRQRCMNPKHPLYRYYGARGITVCERWHTFENFLEDMGEPPDGLTLERKHNDKGYCKSNCVWATMLEQSKNKRQRRDALLWQGRRVKAWAAVWGVSYDTAKQRVYRMRRSHG